MPTLFRFVVTLAILAGIAYGTMFALVMFVEPKKGGNDACASLRKSSIPRKVD